MEDNQICNGSLKTVVIKKGAIIPATSATKSRFYVSLADRSGSLSATIYDERAFGKFIEGFRVKLENVMIKKNYLAVTSRARVSLSPGFGIPVEVRAAVAPLPGTNSMTLQEALTSPVKTITNIKGKVLAVSPVSKKSVQDNTVEFQEIRLQDETTCTTMAVWAGLTNAFVPGDLVKINKCRVKLFKEEKKLSTTEQTTYEKVNSDPQLDNLTDPDDEDNQFSTPGSDSDTGMMELLFDSILDIDPYMSCPNPRCNNKKLRTEQQPDDRYLMVCESCNGKMMASRANKYAVGIFSVNRGDERLELSMFLPEIKKLCEANGKELAFDFDKDSFMINVVSNLPITASCKVRGKTINTNLICNLYSDIQAKSHFSEFSVSNFLCIGHHLSERNFLFNRKTNAFLLLRHFCIKITS